MEPLTPPTPRTPLTTDHARREGERRRRRLQVLGLNSPGPEPAFDRVARLAGQLAQAPLALVNLVGDERQLYRGLFLPPAPGGEGEAAGRAEGGRSGAGRAGAEAARAEGVMEGVAEGPDPDAVPDLAREAPLDYGFCFRVVMGRAPFLLDDIAAHPDPEVTGNPMVRELGVRAYLGTPLPDHTGLVLGTVCVADLRPRRWGRQHQESLRELAGTLLAEFRVRDSLLAQQQELFAVFDAVPFPVMLTQGPDHLLRYANAGQGMAFGRVRQLSPGRQVLPGLDAVGVFDTMDRALRTGETATLPEAPIASYDSRSPQIYRFTCAPVRVSPKAPVSGVLTVGINITGHSPADAGSRRLAADLTSQVERLNNGGGPPRP
ncbi:PAS domain-containing protein [Streptomyces sp. DSM 44917]|uniref:PAS domain-containing protein n=1 Tax=Streptomyces boetiae TaxID=3075541 RepID=A0ABU2L4S7_9ACTN|nr:GAF domain-containing protein [Streptomyces sp. DSM 44917]MDT0306382.1 PAS domain-containing protein [Streptomyces sp. DSM 44917]